MNELIKLLKESNYTLNDDAKPYELENTWVRRFFRCWLDGSYNGYLDYQQKTKLVKTLYLNSYKDKFVINHKRKSLRGFVINEFTKFLKYEFKLSEYKVKKSIFDAFNYDKTNKIELDDFTNLLIDDAYDIYYLEDCHKNPTN